jgi:pyruvate formate lyase activating enzyme
MNREIQLYPERCIGCDECIRLCPEGARTFVNGVRTLDRGLCTTCGLCTDACFAGAMEMTGQTLTVNDVMRDVQQDRDFYEASGGGVTLSGGEPVLQGGFAGSILEACKQAGIHTAIETAGNYPWPMLEALLPCVDLVMMDLKQMNPAKHRWATGASNERIIENARHLAQTHKPILFRIPIVPTVNERIEEVQATANFVRTLIELRASDAPEMIPAPIDLELLSFHKLAGDKYRSLGLENRAADLQPLPSSTMIALANAASDGALTVRCR